MLLGPDREHKNVFPDVPVVGFRNGKSLKNYLVTAALLKTNETRKCESCGKKTCLVCNSIRATTTFTTEACREVYKIQSYPGKSNSEKVPYLLNLKCVLRLSMLKKPKLSSDIGSTTIKANIGLSEKYPRNFFMIIIVWMIIWELMIGILLFSSNVRHISNLKRGKSFGSTDILPIRP